MILKIYRHYFAVINVTFQFEYTIVYAVVITINILKAIINVDWSNSILLPLVILFNNRSNSVLLLLVIPFNK